MGPPCAPHQGPAGSESSDSLLMPGGQMWLREGPEPAQGTPDLALQSEALPWAPRGSGLATGLSPSHPLQVPSCPSPGVRQADPHIPENTCGARPPSCRGALRERGTGVRAGVGLWTRTHPCALTCVPTPRRVLRRVCIHTCAPSLRPRLPLAQSPCRPLPHSPCLHLSLAVRGTPEWSDQALPPLIWGPDPDTLPSRTPP